MKLFKKLYSQISHHLSLSSGFASILPLLIIAFAAISSSTPLLVENLLNGNPPGQKIASDDVQQIAADPDSDCTKNSSGKCITCTTDSYCERNGGKLCAEGYCYNTPRTLNQRCGENEDCISSLVCRKNSSNVNVCQPKGNHKEKCDENPDCLSNECDSSKACTNPCFNLSKDTCTSSSWNSLCFWYPGTNEGKSLEGCKNKLDGQGNACGQNSYCFNSNEGTTIKAKYCVNNSYCSQTEQTAAPPAPQTFSVSGTITMNPAADVDHITIKNRDTGETKKVQIGSKTSSVGYIFEDQSNGTYTFIYTAYSSAAESVNSNIGVNQKSITVSGAPASGQNVTIETLQTGTGGNQADTVTVSGTISFDTSTYIEEVQIGASESDGSGFSGKTIKVQNNGSPVEYSIDSIKADTTYTFTFTAFKAKPTTNDNNIGTVKSIKTGGFSKNTTNYDVTILITNSATTGGGGNPGGGDPNPVGGNQPGVTGGTISGTVNVVGSATAKKVTVEIGGKEYNATNSGGIAFKYESDTLSAGSYTVTATADLSSGQSLSSSKTANSGDKNVDLTIRTDTKNIIDEVCGENGGVAEGTINGFAYTACLKNRPTTLAQADAGKFNATQASKTAANGNPYCGTTAFDIYKCKNNGVIEALELNTDKTCSALPWCAAAGQNPIQPDPCAGPDNRPETCSCQPSSTNNPTFSQDNCATDLFCASNKTQTGYACCPEGEQLCPSTNTCVSRFASCAPGQATLTPIPTQFQNLGCPDINDDDGSKNICSSTASGQPADGFVSGSTVSVNGKTYTRNKLGTNGDAACANYYKTSHPTVKYCWTESNSGSQGGNSGGGGTGGQQPGSGSPGVDGKACTTDDECKIGFTNPADRKCSNSWINNQGTQGSKACCNFDQRFCTQTSTCVSRASDCVSPTPEPAAGGGGSQTCNGGPGAVTNHCGSGYGDCCAGYACTGTGAGASCKVRGQDDPESKCATANGFECSDTYDATRYVNDPVATDVCRSEGKKYCLKAGSGTGSSGNQPDFFAKGTCDVDYFTCEAAADCPSGTRSTTARPQDNAACKDFNSAKPICCLKPQYASVTSSSPIASLEDNSCTTSRDCVSSKTGNACVFFANGQNGICKTY